MGPSCVPRGANSVLFAKFDQAYDSRFILQAWWKHFSTTIWDADRVLQGKIHALLSAPSEMCPVLVGNLRVACKYVTPEHISQTCSMVSLAHPYVFFQHPFNLRLS